MSTKQRSVGIYVGTFDPVHTGHVTFALQALKSANLDRVVFIPERQPRQKEGVEHFGHRVAMLKRALLPHPQLDVLELVDIRISAIRTLPKLKQLFAGDQLVFLFGSDVVAGMNFWPGIERILKDSGLVIGLRKHANAQRIKAEISSWQSQPATLLIVPSFAPDVTSGDVREALYKRRPVKGLLSSVERYSNRNWLYVSLI